MSESIPEVEGSEYGPGGGTVLFENDRVRVTEMKLEPGGRSKLHTHDLDYMLVQIEGDKIAVEDLKGSTFTITAEDFSSDNATAANDVYPTWLDKLAASTTEQVTVVYASDRELNVRRRDGGAGSPTKPFETTVTLGSAGASVTVQRTAD